MKYTVVWRESVLAQVRVRVFLDLEMDVHYLTTEQAVDKIVRLLSTTPLTCGESREDPERVLIVPPLTVFFEVFEEDKVVMIYQAKYRRR
jgi:hypothetical protein